MKPSLNQDKERVIQAFIAVLIYGIAFYLIQLFLWNISVVPGFPDGERLIAGNDGGWYRSIAEHGYVHNKDTGSNTAFFILFPLLWKISCTSPWGISFLNLVFFAIGIALLVLLYPINIQTQILWLSTPSLVFMLIPYSEALFFMLMAICFYGIVRQKNILVFAALFLISLTRSVSIVLIPGFLVMLLVSKGNENLVKTLVRYLYLYCLPLFSGLGLFCWYQYKATGIWFDYFDQQSKYWSHIFALPVLPFFNSLGGWRMVWINALSMFISFIACIYLFKILYKWLTRKYFIKDKILIVSLSYLFCIGLIMIFYGPTYGSHTTNIYGAHRYIFASPFFFVFLYYFTEQVKYNSVHFITILFLSNAFWLLFSSYSHIQHLLLLNVATMVVFLYMFYAKKYSWSSIVITVLNVFLQVSFFQQLISGGLPE